MFGNNLRQAAYIMTVGWQSFSLKVTKELQKKTTN